MNEKGTRSSLFYEASINLILKPGKYITRKENYTPILLITIDTNMYNKLLANQIH